MKRFFDDTCKYWEYAKRAAISELKSEVASSRLSWLWWILDPLLFMLVYSFVSIIVFDKSEKYLAAFIFIGLSSWDFFSKTIKQSVKLVSGNSAVVSKVYLPKYILIYIQMLINGFKMMISYGLVVGMMILYWVPISYRIIYVIPLFAVLIVVTFGISTIMLHCGVFVEDLFNVINAFLRLVFYLSGIFYSIANRIDGVLEIILLKCNPIAMIMDGLRNCMIYKKNPDFVMIGIWGIIGLTLSAIGVRLIYKNANNYVKVF